MNYNAHIRTLGHHAEAKIGQRSLTVSAGSEPVRTNTCPVELLLTSLGSWMALTISAVAEHKKIPLTKTEIDINLCVEQGRPTVSAFEVEIDLGPGLDKREQQILFNVARSCDIHKILAGETSFEYRMIEREPSEEAA